MKPQRINLAFLIIGLMVANNISYGQTPENNTDEPLPAEVTPNRLKPDYADTAKEKITQVLAEPELKHTETITAFRFKSDESSNKVAEPDSSDFWKLIQKFARFIARISEVAIWACAAVIVFLLFVYRDRWLGFFGFGRPKKIAITATHHTTTSLSGQRLPDDIPGAVLKLWQQNEKVAALSMLYRGTLAALAQVHRLALPDGATEVDVVNTVSSQKPQLSDYVKSLTTAWQRLAYAQREPAQIDDLVNEYRRHFGSPQ